MAKVMEWTSQGPITWPLRNVANLANDGLYTEVTYSSKFPWCFCPIFTPPDIHASIGEMYLFYRWVTVGGTGCVAAEEANTPGSYANSLQRQKHFGGRQWGMIHVLMAA